MARHIWLHMSSVPPNKALLQLLSVVIPAQNEGDCVASTVEHLYVDLRLHNVPHEIIVVDDGNTDGTWTALDSAKGLVPTLRSVKNPGPQGFGRAVAHGFAHVTGDAVVVMMADESDDCRDVVRYWEKLIEGYDRVFGSRFMRGGGAIDYPKLKLDVPAKLQSLGKSHVQHLRPGILNDVVAPRASGRQEPREGEDEAGSRGQPLSQSVCEGAKFCQGHVFSPPLLTM